MLRRPLLRLAIAIGTNGLIGMAALAADISAPVSPPQNPLSRAPALKAEATWSPYLAMRNGASLTDSTRFGTAASVFDTDYQPGLHTGAAAGVALAPMAFGLRPRFEIEASTASFEVDKHTVSGVGAGSVDSFGKLTTYSGFVNVYVDWVRAPAASAFVDTPWWQRIEPFVGAGIGYTHATMKRMGASATGVVMDASDDSWSWQVSGGLALAVSDATTIELGVRHQETPDLNFTARDGTRTGISLDTNIITLGIRRQF